MNSENELDLYFQPLYEGGWKFKSVLTGNVYRYTDFLTRKGPKYPYWYDLFEKKLKETEHYKSFSVFHFHWVKQHLFYQMLEFRDDEYQKALARGVKYKAAERQYLEGESAFYSEITKM